MFDFGVGNSVNLILNSAISNCKFVHSWLFCGDELEILNEVAKNFAMAICCVGEVRPCFKCENCKAFLDGVYVDFAQLSASEQFNKSSFTVDQARKIIGKMYAKPLNGKFLIFLICGIDKLLPNCSNLFLKILEEPPNNVVLLLTAKNLAAVLPTIVSRCRLVKILGMSEKKCVEILGSCFPNFDECDLKKAAHFGGGLLGKSRQFLKNSLWQEGLKIATNLFELYLQKNELKFLSVVSKMEGDVSLLEVVFDCFCTLLHDMLNEKRGRFEVNFNEIKRVVDCFEQAKVAVLTNCNLKIALTNLSCRLFSN